MDSCSERGAGDEAADLDGWDETTHVQANSETARLGKWSPHSPGHHRLKFELNADLKWYNLICRSPHQSAPPNQLTYLLTAWHQENCTQFIPMILIKQFRNFQFCMFTIGYSANNFLFDFPFKEWEIPPILWFFPQWFFGKNPACKGLGGVSLSGIFENFPWLGFLRPSSKT